MQNRHHGGPASKGSQLHLQHLVNNNQEYLNCLILSSCPSLRNYAAMQPKWVSPLAAEDYCEYQDERFLEAIGFPQLKQKLAEFWPRRGPVWDALAIVEGKEPYCRDGQSWIRVQSQQEEPGTHYSQPWLSQALLGSQA